MIEYVEKTALSTFFGYDKNLPSFASVTFEGNVIIRENKDGKASFFNLSVNPLGFFCFLRNIEIPEDVKINFVEFAELFSYSEGQNIVFRNFSNVKEPVMLYNAGSVIPYSKDEKNMYYLLKRNNSLSKFKVSGTKINKIIIGRPSTICRSVNFVVHNKQNSQLVVGTQEGKVEIYSLPSFTVIFETDLLKENIGKTPEELICVDANNNALLYKSQEGITLYFIERERNIFLSFAPQQEEVFYSVINIAPSMFVVFVPNALVAVFDVCTDIDYVYSTHKYMTETDVTGEVVPFIKHKNIVFSDKKKSIMTRKINWAKMEYFIKNGDEKVWRFVAHILTHGDVSNFAEDLTKVAIEENRPFDLSNFFTELCISNVYHLVEKNRSRLKSMLAFIPKRFVNSNESNVADAKMMNLVEELVYSNYETERDETALLITSSYDNDYSPLGFSTVTMTYLLLLLAMKSKVPKQKLPSPISSAYIPTILFTNLSHEDRKQFKEFTDTDIRNFVIDFITKQTSSASNIPDPTVSSPYYSLLREAAIFHSALVNHLPYAQKEFANLGELIDQNMPLVGKMHLARNGIIQSYGKKYCKDKSLFVRAPLLKSCERLKTNIPSPSTLIPFSKVKGRDKNLFEPLSRTIEAAESIRCRVEESTINKYSFDNLFAFYAPK